MDTSLIELSNYTEIGGLSNINQLFSFVSTFTTSTHAYDHLLIFSELISTSVTSRQLDFILSVSTRNSVSRTGFIVAKILNISVSMLIL